MSVEQPIEANEQETPEAPLGQRLIAARERKGLSREAIASDLRLQLRLVKALEEDDDERLPPPAFVIGYLRSYARRVDLPEQEVIAAYTTRTQDGVPRIVSRAKNSQVSSQDWPVRFVTWIIVMGLAALLVFWWISNRPLAEHQALTESEPMPPSLPPAIEAPADGGEAAPAGEETSGPVLTAEQAPEPVLETVTENDEGMSAAAPTAVQPEATPIARPQTASPANSLRLVFSADSWTEVTDVTGRSLFYDLAKEGRTLELVGEPPFRLFFGYAPGVEVHYDGTLIDHRAYHRRDMARFTVGKALEE